MPRNTIFLNLQRSQQARIQIGESHPFLSSILTLSPYQPTCSYRSSHRESIHWRLWTRVYPLETPTLTLGTVLLPWPFHPWIPRLVSLQWTCRRLYFHHISRSVGTLPLGVDRIPKCFHEAPRSLFSWPTSIPLCYSPTWRSILYQAILDYQAFLRSSESKLRNRTPTHQRQDQEPTPRITSVIPTSDD